MTNGTTGEDAPQTDPGAGPGTDRGTSPGTGPGASPGADPGASPGADPGTTSIRATSDNPRGDREANQQGDPKGDAAWWEIFLPNQGAWFFLYLLFGFLFIRPELLLWDGGTCRHFLNGLYMLSHHDLPTVNYTSAIFPGSSCLTRCWLGDLISGSFYRFANLNGLVFVSSFAVVLGLTWSYQIDRRKGLGLVGGLLALVITMATVFMHWSARCHLYTYLPFIALYYVIFVVRERSLRTIAAQAAIMAFWVNLHGSWAIGILTLGASLAGNTYDYLRTKDKSLARICQYDLAALFTSVLATGLNPRGFSFYTTIVTYLANPVVIHKTDEWKSFDLFVGPSAFAFLFMCGLVLWLIWYTKRLPPTRELILLVMLFASGIYAMRLIPYFAFVAPPSVGPAWQALRKRRREEVAGAGQAHSSLPKNLVKILDIEERAEPDEKTSLKVIILSLAASFIMGIVFMTVPYFKVSDFDKERIPVEAVDYLNSHNVEGLGFNYDNWGGYLYYKRGKPVFIDDWTDFLPPEFIEQYLNILTAKGDWVPTFNKYNFKWVLVPKAAPIAQILAKSPAWQTVWSDKENCLLIKQSKPSSP